jgi:hypothetical protein
MVRTNANAVLTGENSLFASTFLWTSVSGPSAPSIDNPTGMVAIFNANTAGTYVVNLSVNGGASSKNVTITADDNFPDPLNIKFAQVKNELQNVPHVLNKRCVDCHTAISTPGQQVTTSLIPPIWYSSALAGGGDRDGDGAVTATDDAWFLKALSARVNLTEILASALLRKPTGNHHGGNQVIDVTDTTGLGGLRSYSVIYNWILAGMQPGGVAANPVIGSTTALTFSGAPLFSTGIALDASTSIGPVNYLWTVSGPLGPTGASAVIANPTSASATLFVPNTGTYVVQLRVDDGVSSDTETRTIAVTEASVVASFNPQTGPATLANVSAGRGDITLSSTSTYGTGIPLTCRWQVLSGPFGALLDGSATLDVTKSCAVPAVLNVPTSAAGSSYSVQLTASALGSISVAGPQSLTISSNSPTASLGNTPASFTVTFSANGSPVNVTSNTQQNGLGTSGTFSFNTAQASVTLQGSASLPNGSPITDYRWCLTSQPDSTNFPASIPACSNSQVSSGTSSSIAMTARATGSYTVQLTVTNGFGNSAPVTKPFTVVLPAGAVTFAGTGGIKSILGCASCHMYGNATANTLFNTASGTANVAPPWDDTNTKEGDTLYQRIRQRVNLSTPTSSLLLVCPSAGCAPGMGSYSWASGSAPYDSVRNWIQAGAPPGN